MTGLVVFAVVLLWGARPVKRTFREALSQDATLPWKGFFILWVFLSHFGQYAPLEVVCGKQTKIVCGILGQLMVAPFLFFSGFGVMESIRKKGARYLDSFPSRRILKTLLHFDIAVAVFVAVAWAMGIRHTFPCVALAFTGWTSIGNSNWYVFAILCCYLIAFAAFRPGLAGRPERRFLLQRIPLAAVLTGCYIAAMVLCRRPDYWWNTVLCFPLGLAASAGKERASGLFGKSTPSFWASLVLLTSFCGIVRNPCGIFAFHRPWPDWAEMPVVSLAFVLALALCSMQIRIGNRVLDWCGKHLFAIYILQRIPMNVLKGVESVSETPPLYFATCLAMTAVLASLFDRATETLDKVLGLK